MIVDTTRTKIEWDMTIADVQEQLRLTANDPDLTIVCGYPLPYIVLSGEELKSLSKFKISDFSV